MLWAIEAAKCGDTAEERRLLESVVGQQASSIGEARRRRSFAVAANNLAWNLSRDPNDLPRALQLAETALRTNPDRLEFLATRGRILELMGRHAEAIRDLEWVAEKLRPDEKLAKSIQSLYEKLAIRPNPLREPPRWMGEAKTVPPTARF
ncbi:MAG: hypothetical protein AAGJ83_16050 [Planctomycetota bacterium]